MNLIAHINAKDAERNLHWCPCCKERNDADDMDLARSWEHSGAMRAVYGSACCNACVDDHLITADGVLMPYARTVQGADGRYSSHAALDEARWEGREQAAHEATCRGWL